MFKYFVLFVTMAWIVVSAYDPITQKTITQHTQQNAHISPEIIEEFKDFENLIPTATIDEIVAKHYLIDKNFRIALNYLRSQEFTQLQKQLLNIPEIVDILEFLHLTAENATMTHMGATKTKTVKVSLHDYNDVDSDDNDDAEAATDKRVIKMTTNTGTANISKPNALTIENVKGTLNNIKEHERPQKFQMAKEFNDDNYKTNNYNKNKDTRIFADDKKNAVEGIVSEKQPSVHIVLLENLEVNAGHHNLPFHYFHKSRRQNNNYQHHNSLGTFTKFVEEVLQHLPHAEYQSMILDKCKKNVKFAKFYAALRSNEFKIIVDEKMLTVNIKKIIQTLNGHNVDIKELEPIAFKLISWGPNI